MKWWKERWGIDDWFAYRWQIEEVEAEEEGEKEEEGENEIIPHTLLFPWCWATRPFHPPSTPTHFSPSLQSHFLELIRSAEEMPARDSCRRFSAPAPLRVFWTAKTRQIEVKQRKMIKRKQIFKNINKKKKGIDRKRGSKTKEWWMTERTDRRTEITETKDDRQIKSARKKKKKKKKKKQMKKEEEEEEKEQQQRKGNMNGFASIVTCALNWPPTFAFKLERNYLKYNREWFGSRLWSRSVLFLFERMEMNRRRFIADPAVTHAGVWHAEVTSDLTRAISPLFQPQEPMGIGELEPLRRVVVYLCWCSAVVGIDSGKWWLTSDLSASVSGTIIQSEIIMRMIGLFIKFTFP